jgi:hypothetical protein
MAAVAKGLPVLGALFYVALKVWQSLSRAEPIDLFPMLRPFAIGICIMFFSTLFGKSEWCDESNCSGSHSMLENQVWI